MGLSGINSNSSALFLSPFNEIDEEKKEKKAGKDLTIMWPHLIKNVFVYREQ